MRFGGVECLGIIGSTLSKIILTLCGLKQTHLDKLVASGILNDSFEFLLKNQKTMLVQLRCLLINVKKFFAIY